MASSPRRASLIALLLVAACSSGHPGHPVPSHPSSTSPAPSGAGPYQKGECLEPAGRILRQLGCDQPHPYEVTTTGPLPAGKYPPPVKTKVRPLCHAALPAYLGSADADASRLETLAFWPTSEQWKAGGHWYACLVTERGTDNEPTHRTGPLAGALAHGLGAFQRCIVKEPISSGPLRVVPCDRPHRSEAVPGVMRLGSPTSPPPSPTKAMLDRGFKHCKKAVRAYLGGDRPGVEPFIVLPTPEQWRSGDNNLICFAVAGKPVTAPMGRA